MDEGCTFYQSLRIIHRLYIMKGRTLLRSTIGFGMITEYDCSNDFIFKQLINCFLSPLCVWNLFFKLIIVSGCNVIIWDIMEYYGASGFLYYTNIVTKVKTYHIELFYFIWDFFCWIFYNNFSMFHQMAYAGEYNEAWFLGGVDLCTYDTPGSLYSSTQML